MVSPTIGRHLRCTVQNSAKVLGFELGAQNQCPLLTALDGLAAPAEYPAISPVLLSQADLVNDPGSRLVAQCREQGDPAALCDGLQAVSRSIGVPRILWTP